LGQIVLVLVGQVRCLYQTCPTGTGKGKKRPLLVPGTSHIPTLEAFPCPGTSSIPTMEPVPVPLVPTCPCSPTLGQVEWFSWTDPLSLSHLSHEDLKTPFSLSHLSHVDLKTPFSLSHLSHVLQLVPTCPIWLYHLSFANSLFSDFFWGFS